MLTSKTYVVAWDEVMQNSLNISQQLVNGNVAHKFFNVSSFPNQTKHWEVAEHVRYYGHFFRAIKDFLATDHDIFIFNAGDIEYDKYAQYISIIENYYSDNENLALFAPESTNDVWSGWGSLIAKSQKYSDLYLSTNTDGTYLAMSREIAEYVNRFYDWSLRTKKIDFATMYSGWGLDHVYCSLAIYLNKIIYRDSSILVFHPVGKSYDLDRAVEEVYLTLHAYLDFAEGELGFDRERLRYIINKTLGKIKMHDREPLGLAVMYDDLELVKDA